MAKSSQREHDDRMCQIFKNWGMIVMEVEILGVYETPEGGLEKNRRPAKKTGPRKKTGNIASDGDKTGEK